MHHVDNSNLLTGCSCLETDAVDLLRLPQVSWQFCCIYDRWLAGFGDGGSVEFHMFGCGTLLLKLTLYGVPNRSTQNVLPEYTFNRPHLISDLHVIGYNAQTVAGCWEGI